MGTNKLPLFLDPQLDWQAELLDKWFFKKGPADVVDRPLFRFTLGAINKGVSDDIPDEFKPEFHQAFDLVMAGDYDDAGAEAIDVLVQIVNKLNVKQGTKDVVIGLLGVLKGVLAGLD